MWVLVLHVCKFAGILYYVIFASKFTCACLCLSHYGPASRTLHAAHSPSPCLHLYALCSWSLFLFAGRAKAEPARQTTTKRRKRKNSASSANSSVGTTASKKRSPATNFSLSSQVPVSISSTRFASFFISVSVFTCMFAELHTFTINP